MKNTLYIFYASWCHKCQKLEFMLDGLCSKGLGGLDNIDIRKIDVVKETHLAAKFSITTLPTIIFPSGERHVGDISRMRFLSLLGHRALKKKSLGPRSWYPGGPRGE